MDRRNKPFDSATKDLLLPQAANLKERMETAISRQDDDLLADFENELDSMLDLAMGAGGSRQRLIAQIAAEVGQAQFTLFKEYRIRRMKRLLNWLERLTVLINNS
ncbi:MAG: hypothetical protein HY673_17415 [Chloroflexi bacterium]|nr:hypothetical protein [Chloroflexota bacterium]